MNGAWHRQERINSKTETRRNTVGAYRYSPLKLHHPSFEALVEMAEQRKRWLPLMALLGTIDVLILSTIPQWTANAAPPPSHTKSRSVSGDRSESAGSSTTAFRELEEPRKVSPAVGSARQRAEDLGLGTHEAALDLLRSGVRPEWFDAVQGVPGGGAMHHPLPQGILIRGFQPDRGTNAHLSHRGVDWSAREGTPIRAADHGLVVYADSTMAHLGNTAMVLHPSGEMSVYAHCSVIH
ncbi:MAG: M23 family metallopeptidase, partial [Myxococcota bacterium]